MVPPHDNPTFQAVSSATPNSKVRGLPLSITSIASVTTAPSTQPPDTEPRKLPLSSITRLEPTGRGAEPQVSTTVATATPRPSFRQSSAAFRMSSSRASMSISVVSRPSCRCPRDVYSRHLPQPRLGIAGPAAALRQRTNERGHRVEIVDRAEFVDMWQQRPDAFGLGFEALETQQ